MKTLLAAVLVLAASSFGQVQHVFVASDTDNTFTGINSFTSVVLPNISGSTQCLQVNSVGQVSGTGLACGSGGGISGSGTTNTLPLWTGASALGNSNFSQSGTTMNLSSQTLTFTGTIGRIICTGCNSSPDMFWSTGSSTSPSSADTHIRMEKDIGSGGQIFFVAGSSGASQFDLSSNGTVGWIHFAGGTFAQLPSVNNGSIYYCADCAVATDPCTTGGGTGTGAMAFRLNARWRCQ